MVELLGLIGLLLIIGSLIPFISRRLGMQNSVFDFFARNHKFLALTSLAVLLLHGISALSHAGGRGWQWGKLAHFQGDFLTGALSWSFMLAVVILAARTTRKKPFARTHCWLAVLLVISIFAHI
ncbi:MAG: ferric reductase-like transmembrane domain-containing protein [Bacillota bacterium]